MLLLFRTTELGNTVHSEDTIEAFVQAGLHKPRPVLVEQWLLDFCVGGVRQLSKYIVVPKIRGFTRLRLSEFVQISEFFQFYITDIVRHLSHFPKVSILMKTGLSSSPGLFLK